MREPTQDPDMLAARLRQRAIELGFDACRFTTADAPASGTRFLQALAEGRHAGMEWLARNAEKRIDPQRVLPGARSVVVLAASYPSTHPHGDRPGEAPAGAGVVARYARGPDYHDLLAPALKDLTAWLDAEARPENRSLWYVDTGPILERDLAQRAGLGFVGRHTGLVSRSLGNWFLLAEILTQAELPPDAPARNHCGNCTRCLDACPTGALPAPFTLDARLCISYLTIELKGSIPVELRPLVGNRVFGCDDCLQACPWNRFAGEASLLKPHARPDLATPDLVGLLSMDEAAFRGRFAGTPLLRTKRRALLRNAAVALGNTAGAEALPALQQATRDPEPLVAEHANWAIREIEGRLSRPSDPAVPGTAR